MPSPPKDPVRSVRISEALWARVRDRAMLDGVTRSDVVREALLDYLDDD